MRIQPTFFRTPPAGDTHRTRAAARIRERRSRHAYRATGLGAIVRWCRERLEIMTKDSTLD